MQATVLDKLAIILIGTIGLIPIPQSSVDFINLEPTVKAHRLASKAYKQRSQSIRLPEPEKPQQTVKLSSGLNWAALRQCESGNNYANKNNPLYRGAYQFSYGTWQAMGGSGDPADASPALQDSLAQKLYDQSGASPWPVCGKLL